jgi:hypothetical protein
VNFVIEAFTAFGEFLIEGFFIEPVLALLGVLHEAESNQEGIKIRPIKQFFGWPPGGGHFEVDYIVRRKLANANGFNCKRFGHAFKPS